MERKTSAKVTEAAAAAATGQAEESAKAAEEAEGAENSRQGCTEASDHTGKSVERSRQRR
jgi:hypothetical protein